MQTLKTVFFADSALAQPVFEILLQNGLVTGLCTSRRKLPGANLRHLARLTGIPVFESDRNSLNVGLESWLRELKPDVLLAFTFPYLLPKNVLSLPRLGAFNIHGGKLPEYRGPQPVFWQIVNCEAEGAVTIHRMDEKFDRGAIVASQSVAISPEDTYGLHTARLAFAAVNLLNILFEKLIEHGIDIQAVPQDETRAAFYSRPQMKDLIVRWETQSGEQIRALIKAGNPWNQGALTSIRGMNLRLTDATLLAGKGDVAKMPGEILAADGEQGILVNCMDGSALQLDVISLEEGIFPGRILASYGIQAGELFTTLMPMMDENNLIAAQQSF